PSCVRTCRYGDPWHRVASRGPPAVRAQQSIVAGSPGASLSRTDVRDGETVHGAGIPAFGGRPRRAQLVVGSARLGPSSRRSALASVMKVLVTGGRSEERRVGSGCGVRWWVEC